MCGSEVVGAPAFYYATGATIPEYLLLAASFYNRRLTPMYAAPGFLYVCALTSVHVSAWLLPGKRTTDATTFDTNQLIDVTGAHAFVEAGPNDFRGPCPGLNALANHNYIPHHGVVSVEQAILAATEVFGMGLDFATGAGVLALYGANLLDVPFFEFSIGGPPGGTLGGILGPPTGLSGTHNQFESDSSPTRCDLYECGDNFSLQPDAFQGLLDLIGQNPDPSRNLEILIQHRVARLQHSKANNPYFFYGPIEMLASNLATVLIGGAMTNHSAADPEGFFSYNRNERIPSSWYRRPLDDQYLAVTHAIPDMLRMWAEYPETVLIGGNTGEVDSFVPIDITDLTGGVYSAASLLEGNNAVCFAFQFLQLAFPDIASNLEDLVAEILQQLAETVEPLECPEFETLDLESLSKYPGYTRSAKRSV
ncbi:oxidase-like protein [Mycena leptocephala]|nr:oxidase-like protein [Mycena leptocephala]